MYERVVEGKCGPENTTKIRVPEAAFRVDLLGGHEAAQRLNEMVGGGEVLGRRW
jgi:hypothetical protein